MIGKIKINTLKMESLFTFMLLFLLNVQLNAQHVYLGLAYDQSWIIAQGISSMEMYTIDEKKQGFELPYECVSYYKGLAIKENTSFNDTRDTLNVCKAYRNNYESCYTLIMNLDAYTVAELQGNRDVVYYFYKNDTQLHYTVGSQKVEELWYNPKGQLIEKIVYKFDKMILDYKDDLAQLKAMNPQPVSKFTYTYNDADLLTQIAIETLKKGVLKRFRTLDIEHENERPIRVKQYKGENIASQLEYTKTFVYYN